MHPLETVSIHPLRPLYEACRRMLESRARRIPLVDVDDETKRAMIVNVVTQYRILKFVAVNVTETQSLKKPIGEIKLGTYEGLVTARMESPVIEVIHMLVKGNISCVPILNSDGESFYCSEGYWIEEMMGWRACGTRDDDEGWRMGESEVCVLMDYRCCRERLRGRRCHNADQGLELR